MPGSIQKRKRSVLQNNNSFPAADIIYPELIRKVGNPKIA